MKKPVLPLVLLVSSLWVPRPARQSSDSRARPRGHQRPAPRWCRRSTCGTSLASGRSSGPRWTLHFYRGGAYTGTETIRPIESGHYFDVTVELGGPDGSLRGRGIMFLESGPFGSHLTKYVVYDAGFTLLQPGPVGCDLGGYYSHFWEIPEPIHHNDSSVLIKGRSYYVSPAAYRVNQQISVDDEPFMNFGIMWYTKVMENAEP